MLKRQVDLVPVPPNKPDGQCGSTELVLMHALAVLWKSYLVLWVLFRSFTLGIRLLFDFGPQSAAFLALGVVGFVPLIGFVFGKPIIKPGIWRVWLVFLLIWGAFDRTFYSAWFLQDPFDSQFFGVLMAIPSFAAIYVYSRPTFKAWNASAQSAKVTRPLRSRDKPA